jgi:hypothetical protein
MAETYQKIGTSTLLSTMAYDPPVGAVVAPPLGLLQTGYAVEDIPTAQHFNSLLQGFGEKINHSLQNGIPLWNATTAYTVGNFVNHSNTGWVCVANNTNSTPTTANANWKQVATGRGIKAHARASLLVTTAITTTATAIPFGVNDLVEGTITHSTVSNTTRFTVTEAGTYEFSLQQQITALSNTGDSCTFWLRKNGSTAVANSAFRLLNNSTGHSLFTTSSIVENLSVNDYIEVMCIASANSKYELSYLPASSPVPNIPACIMVVKGW